MRQESVQALPLIQLIAFMERGREPKVIKFVQLGEKKSMSQLKVANKAVVGKQPATPKDSLVFHTGARKLLEKKTSVIKVQLVEM